MRIGDLARRTGLSRRSIRRYETLGLIYSAGRSPSNHRLFDESALWCVEVVSNLRALGLTLREITEVAAVYRDRPDEAIGPPLAERLVAARRRIDARLAELARVRRQIHRFERRHSKVLAGTSATSAWTGDPTRAGDRA